MIAITAARQLAEPEQAAPDLSRPPFMTPRMWFIWLQRCQLSGERAASEEAQREFVVWWGLWGHQIYASDFVLAPEQVAVLMEPVPGGAGTIPRLLRRLHRESPDLCRLFDLDTPGGRTGLLTWFLAYGQAELTRRQPADADSVRPARAGNGKRRRPGAGSARQVAARLPPGTILHPHSELWADAAPLRAERTDPEHDDTGPLVPKRRAARRAARSGINLIGFAFGELGLGEDLRMMSRALDAAGVAHGVVAIPASAHTRANDRSVAERVTDRLRYPVTVFCLNPFDMAEVYAQGREELFQAEHTIGYWPWELPRLPPFWRDAYRLVDEVWAASRYTAASFRDSPVPLRIMPPCVEIPDFARVRAMARRLRAARQDRFRFIFPFDRNSFLARKNPFAAVAAFRAAFPERDRSVELLLRINGERGNEADVARLAAAARADRRILIDKGTLPRAKALALLGSSDCLVSPHRAEGFGRNIAEAILLGVPVLATGFGGCVDFLASEEAIDWQPVAIGEGEYAHATGQWWAEPDVAHLAQRMAEVRQAGHEAAGRRAARAAEFQAVYAAAAVGARYAAELQRIEPAVRAYDERR